MTSATYILQARFGLFIALSAYSNSRAADIPELLADPYRIERGMWFDSLRSRENFSMPSSPEPFRIEITVEGEGVIDAGDGGDLLEFIDEASVTWKGRMPLSEDEASGADLERRARQELIDLQRFGTETVEPAIRW